MEKKLPKGWVETDIDNVVDKMTNGSSLKQSDQYADESYPISRIETIWNETIDFQRVKYVIPTSDDIAKYKLLKGDILFSHINSDKHLGKTAIYDSDKILIHGINLLLLRSNPKINSSFLNYSLRHFRFSGVFIDLAQRAVNQSSINQRKLKGIPFPLPPKAEQERIVAKLDVLFAHLEQVKQRMERVPRLLKNFRQAVLTQAVTGKLTEEWRVGKELEDVDIDKCINSNFEYHILPDRWIKSTINNIGLVKGGKRLPKGEQLVEEKTDFPYIRARDLKEGTVLQKDLLYLKPETQEKIKRYIVNSGDLYITIVGAKIGDAGMIPKEMDGANLTENAAKICRLRSHLESGFISVFLRSSVCQENIKKSIMSAAQGKLALTRIKELPIYLPPLIEQTEIVRRVESLFAKVDKIEAQYEKLKAQIDQLPQALLAKAFRGELVEQLPTDGDAKDLLAEIAKLKAEAAPKKKVTKGRKKVVKKMDVAAEPEARYGKE